MSEKSQKIFPLGRTFKKERKMRRNHRFLLFTISSLRSEICKCSRIRRKEREVLPGGFEPP